VIIFEPYLFLYIFQDEIIEYEDELEEEAGVASTMKTLLLVSLLRNKTKKYLK